MPRSKTKSQSDVPLIDWAHKVAEIPESGLDIERAADGAQCKALAAALDIPACRRLEVRYAIRSIGGGRYRVKGHLDAAVTQSCIVTLNPVDATISEQFEEEYWPPELISEPGPGGEGEEHEALAQTAPEPIQHGLITVGSLIYEQLSTALDPYPRAPDALFSWTDHTEDPDTSGPASNPFAALKSLKVRPDDGQ